MVCPSCLLSSRSPSQSSQLLSPYFPQSLWLGLNLYYLEYTPPSAWQKFPFLGLACGNLAYKAFTVSLGQWMNSWAPRHLSVPLLSQSRPPWYRLWVPAPWEGADAGTELPLDRQQLPLCPAQSSCLKMMRKIRWLTKKSFIYLFFEK